MIDQLLVDTVDSRNPYYSIVNFVIKINFKLEELETVHAEDIEKFAEFVHEYTHYLQSTSTIFGMYHTVLWMQTQSNIIFSNAKILKRREIKLQDFEKFKDQLDKLQYNYYYNRSPREFTNIDLSEGYVVRNVNHKYDADLAFKELFLFWEEDGLFHHISPVVLRENMAAMTEMISRNIGSDSVVDFMKLNHRPSQYWILYNYFYQKFHTIDDHRIFTFYFCELALDAIKPSMFANILFQDINELMNQYENTNRLFSSLLSKHYSYINKSFGIINRVIDKMIENNEKLKGMNEYFYFISKYLNIIKQNLNDKKYVPTILYPPNTIDAKWVSYRSERYFSPLIIQSGNIYSVLNTKEDFTDTISLLFGVGLVLELLINGKEITTCPFLYQVPICSCKKTDCMETCETSPMGIKEFDQGGCLFYNCLLSFGYLDKEELDKHK